MFRATKITFYSNVIISSDSDINGFALELGSMGPLSEERFFLF